MNQSQTSPVVQAPKGARFRERTAFVSPESGYELMPFRHARIPGLPGQVLLTSVVGEYHFVNEDEFARLVTGAVARDSDLYRALRTRQIVCDADRGPFFDGLEAQQRTRKLLASQDPALHILVVTLRCDHRCHYCQVSPRGVAESGFDMSEEMADAALSHVFRSKAPVLTIEFQGGESGLAFERIRYIVDRAETIAQKSGRQVRFVIATTLHLLDDESLRFCRDHGIELSTSLDGPKHVHNANRINRDRDSFERTIEGIGRAREVCGHGRVAALATITRHSLPYAREIIDTYVDLGFGAIALRPLSPFGFAVKAQRKLGYTTEAYLRFYREALDYLVARNLNGFAIEETYATLLLTRILTPFPTPYVDLQSPAAAGTGVLVYNYDGGVYVSDEARMLAAMGDNRFRMGSVHDAPEVLSTSNALKIVRDAGKAEQLPGCETCAFVPYCGADPVFHVATQGDPVGHRPTSEFCGRHTGMFQLIFELLARRDPNVMKVFLSWMRKSSASEIVDAGYLP